MSAVDARDNPHLWLDPVLALTYIDTSWDSLAIVDGEATNTYRENATKYRSEVASLHERLKDQLGAIPEQNRKLVSVENEFLHLASRYGLEPANLPTPISTDEPSPRRIEELEAVLRAQAVPAVFAEKGFESALLQEAAKRAGVDVCYLYGDTLDDEVTTYVEMMEYNGNELVRCLGGG
jgi:ABC-type Zn uptake system ZnuABC Zn-binding protein ZnuA